jgi:hypothetical protein
LGCTRRSQTGPATATRNGNRNTEHNSGSPDTASPEILALMKERIAPFRQRRLDATARAAARLA